MARIVEGFVERNGVTVNLDDQVTVFRETPEALEVLTKSGKTYPAIIGLFGGTVAWTGAKPIAMKILF